ncbi:protocadherin gamma-A12-like [Triplophysa rosa]|uniref:protocadherin gamma-A12-like n=1 Tax=Triplophysa rosa TaxID=992332 RepID=UPI002545E3D7|nr:protocadherin gamma-A12-like [Triplophysa rosa]
MMQRACWMIESLRSLRWKMLWQLSIFLSCYCCTANGHIRYSIPEEMKKGSLIGNVAQDLGLDLKRLRAGRARIVTGDSTQYAELKTDKGILVVRERIDREQLCGDTTPCSFSFEIILENPMELHPVTIEMLDENDHAPSFQNKELKFEISESAALGSRFLLESADDHDVGLNSLQNYILSPNNNFALKQHSNPDGSKYAEMVLQKALDREEHPNLLLKLIAVDGGNPQRSGSVNIDITVLDVNDNAPQFNQSVYRASIMENAPRGSYITTVNATDADAGSNGRITFNFYKQKGTAAQLFNIDSDTGVVSVVGTIDHEKDTKFEVTVEARDQGGLTDSSKIVLEVIDVNDNAPVINIMSFSSTVSEDAPPDTTIAIINVKDSDTDDNGKVRCFIEGSEDFTIKSTLRNYYSLVTNVILDREKVPEYNITVSASDSGRPPLISRKTLHLKVTDVNDNAPVFQDSVYNSFLLENNSPGVSILQIKADDPDENQNARISYILEEGDLIGSPVGTYVSVNAESGVVHAVRSFDYEQIKNIKITIKAQDGGSPPLCSNVTVNIFIQDQNDNAPQVLYPVQSGGSVVAEIVPRSADVGYLVTKVVAVDVDSGQNAWLSYKLQKATDRALFEVGLQNGEIRTVRQVTDKDAVKQRLAVVVEDNGQPSRSATVNVNVALADSFPEVLSEFTDFTHDKEYNDNLTFYLVLALAVVSFLFIVSIIAILSVKCYRWRRERMFYKSGANLPVIPYYPPLYADVGGTGTLQHVYNYDVCRTTDSRKSDLKYVRPCSESIISLDTSGTQTLTHAQREKMVNDESFDPVRLNE